MTTKPDDLKRTAAETWPKAGASVAIFRGPDVLLIERAHGIREGLWSLPGGHIEPGETALAAATRELAEETGIVATINGLADIQDVIVHDADGRLLAHYLLAVFYGHWRAGEPSAATDARCARFVAPAELGAYNLTPGTNRIIALTAAKLQV